MYSWNAVFNWIADRKVIICQPVYLLSSKTVTIHAKPWHTPPFCGPLIVMTLIRLLEKQIPFWKPKWLTAHRLQRQRPRRCYFPAITSHSVWTPCVWSAQKSINSSMLTACLELLLWTICLVSPFCLRAQTGMYGSFKAQISLDLQFFSFFLFSTYSQWDFCGKIGPLSTKHDTCVGVRWCANSHNGSDGSKT